MWSNGYRLTQDKNALKEMSVARDGAFVRNFGALAAALQMAIGITFLERQVQASRSVRGIV